MTKAALICAVSIGLSQPVAAQSIFGGFGETEDAAQDRESAELLQWKRAIHKKIIEHTSAVSLAGYGRVTVHFCVDPAGRIARIKLAEFVNNAQALVTLGTISSLTLPPQPASVRAKTKGGCYEFSQKFWYN